MPLRPKYNLTVMVFDWLDRFPVGQKFGPEKIQIHIESITGGACRPQDGTITRYIRKYNEHGGDVTCVSISKSLYVKNRQRSGV